jgi:hypothetical protein
MGVPKRLKPQTSRAVRWITLGMVCLATVQCWPTPPPDIPPPPHNGHLAREIDVLHDKELAICAKSLVPAAREILIRSAGGEHGEAWRQRVDDEATVLAHVLLVHDQQRVIVGDQYGAMACAAAVVRDPTQSERWPLVAIVEVGTGAVPQHWPYPPGDTTCVYLNREEKKARLSRYRDGNCPITDAFPGEHHVIVDPTISGDSYYPPMARWDFDPETGMMYLGTTCGAAWCTIAPENARLSPPLTTGPPHLRIKGWYDEQFVAYRPAAANVLVPSRLILRIMPHEGLGSRWKQLTGPNDVPANQLNSPQQVATIHVPSPLRPGAGTALEQYALRWGYPVPPVGPGTVLHVEMNLLSNLMGQGRYELPGAPASPALGWRQFERKPDPGNVVDALRALEGPKGPYLPLGIARWGWDERDESAWVRCGYGCCRVSDPH